MVLKDPSKKIFAVPLQTKSFFFRSYMNDSDRSYMNDVQHSTIWHTYVLGKDKNIDLDLTICSRIYEELKKRLGIHQWFIYYSFISHGYKYHFQIIIKKQVKKSFISCCISISFFYCPYLSAFESLL